MRRPSSAALRSSCSITPSACSRSNFSARAWASAIRSLDSFSVIETLLGAKKGLTRPACLCPVAGGRALVRNQERITLQYTSSPSHLDPGVGEHPGELVLRDAAFGMLVLELPFPIGESARMFASGWTQVFADPLPGDPHAHGMSQAVGEQLPGLIHGHAVARRRLSLFDLVSQLLNSHQTADFPVRHSDLPVLPGRALLGYGLAVKQPVASARGPILDLPRLGPPCRAVQEKVGVVVVDAGRQQQSGATASRVRPWCQAPLTRT